MEQASDQRERERDGETETLLNESITGCFWINKTPAYHTIRHRRYVSPCPLLSFLSYSVLGEVKGRVERDGTGP